MAKKSTRSPMQVSHEFKTKLDQIQKKIMMARGEKRSLRDLTTDIVQSQSFADIEKNMIKVQKDIDKLDIKIKFDMRKI